MEVKYSHSLENMVMSWWEEMTFFSPNTLDRVYLYGRYIDDLLLVGRSVCHTIVCELS